MVVSDCFSMSAKRVEKKDCMLNVMRGEHTESARQKRRVLESNMKNYVRVKVCVCVKQWNTNWIQVLRLPFLIPLIFFFKVHEHSSGIKFMVVQYH